MFSFWYCHKRGKEVRLAKAAEAEKAGEEGEGEGEDEEEYEEEDDDEEEGEGDEEGEEAGAETNDIAEGLAQATIDESSSKKAEDKEKA